MNTKTSLKRVYNYYNGTEHGVGRDSPGALLDMLAEVASQTLHSEKKRTESSGPSKIQSKTDSLKRKCQQEPFFNSSQLLSMPATQLVKQFSVFTSDELKRQYSYTCALVPGCGQRYTSFASEGRARMSIKAHLADHLDYLKRDKEAYSTFTAIAVKNRSPKSNPSNKKPRINQPKKPAAEALNKENKETKAGKSTNYLRKILSNEMSFTEFEKQKTLAKLNRTSETRVLEIKKDPDEVEIQVLGDHSYYEHVKLDNDDQKINSDLNEMMVNQAMGENIMLMVVESDGVHMKELPYIAQDISVRTDQDESEAIYIPESVTWSEDVYTKNMDTSVLPKPKGKAKFIGTSKEEREMALALMDRIKRKGNPAGGNLQCRICDPPRSFTAPTTLVSHYRSHAGIKPYECRICRAVFTRRHSLKYHMLIHQNQTRFTCADCGKKFRHPSHFREHRRRHTGEAPFGCEDCGQRFKTRNTYKRHLKTRHGKVLTTTGELLHLSEEDFQKVRTNPKRKPEPIYSESMIDEDVTAPEAILQFQNQDSNNLEEDLQISESLAENYQILSKEDVSNSTSEVWDIENVVTNDDVVDDVEKEGYRDSEYFHESEMNKTDYIKTDIAINNCEFEEVENTLHELQYNEKESESCDRIENDSIGDDIQEHDGINDIKTLKSKETIFDEEQGVQEKIFLNEQLSEENSNLLESVEGINVMESENNYNLHNERNETSVDYFEDNLGVESELKYSECVRTTEHIEQIDIGRYEEMNTMENCNEPSRINITDHLMSQKMMNCEERNQNVLVDNNGDNEIFQQNNSLDTEHNCMQKLNQNRYLLDDTRVKGETEEGEKAEQNGTERSSKYSTINDKSPRSNVAVEHIVQYPTTNYEAEHNQSSNNTTRIYLQTNQSNNIIIKNKNLMNLLTQQIKLQNSEKLELPKNGKVIKLLNGQSQSFNLLQKGKQSTVLVLATSDDVKNNLLQIDTTTGVAKAIKTLPVIAVQQK